MQVVAEKVKGKDLQPGDLFSTADQNYWNWTLRAVGVEDDGLTSIGEKCYIRTNAACPEDQQEVEIYRLTVLR